MIIMLANNRNKALDAIYDVDDGCTLIGEDRGNMVDVALYIVPMHNITKV